MNWSLALPEFVLSVCGLFILVFGVVQKREHTAFACNMLAVAAFVATGFLVLTSADGVGYQGIFVNDNFARFTKILILGAATLGCVLSLDYNAREKIEQFEYPVLVLFSTVGAMVMVSAANLMTLFVGLELSSLALYILCAFARDDGASSEAGLKYFVLGSLASGIVLYGISFIYGFAGSMEYGPLAHELASVSYKVAPGLVVGAVFLLVGLCFKLSAAPFHMWTPDVYQGAPTPVTAFLATAPKVAAFALLLRVMNVPFDTISHQWQLLIEVVAVLSMVIGSVAAIVQDSIKRLMAYSSVAHMGYALIGLAVASATGISHALVYLTAYLLMTMGAFAVITAMRRNGHRVDKISDLAGMSKTQPVLALCLAIFMFSLTGVPPLAGFFAKFLILGAAMQGGFYTLAGVGVVASVVSAFYYLRVVKAMYFDEASAAGAIDDPALSASFISIAMGVATVFFFVILGPVSDMARLAAKSLTGL